MHITARKGVQIFREYYLNMPIKQGPCPKTAKIPVDFCTKSVLWKKQNGDFVQKYDILAVLENGTPVYSPFSGTFNGFSVGPKLGRYNAMQYALLTTEENNAPSSPLWDISKLPQNKEDLRLLAIKAGLTDELRSQTLATLFENGKEYTCLLLDAVDDEPFELSKSAVLLQHTEEVFGGAQILATALGLQGISVIARKNFITAQFFKKKTPPFQKIVFRGKYPAFPTLIQYTAKNKALRMGVEACRALYRAAVFGEPQLSHIVTVWGDGVKNPCNLEVQNGTPISDLLNYCQAEGTLERVVAGGVMTGYTASVFYALYPWDTALTAILQKKHHTPGTCTSCGRCARVCPVGLAPYYTLQKSNLKGIKLASQLCGELCLHCGACSYICPARLPLEEHLQAAGNLQRSFFYDKTN